MKSVRNFALFGAAGIALVVSLPFTLSSVQAVSPEQLATCSFTVGNPHQSSNTQNTIIAKPYWQCPTGDSEHVTSWLGYLYECSTQPDKTKGESTWKTSNGCRAVRSASSSDSGSGYGEFTVPSGGSVRRNIPKEGVLGVVATGNKWYIACTRGYYSGSNAFAAVSNPVKL